MKHQTRAYWPARIMLAAFLASVAVALLRLAAPQFMGAAVVEGPMGWLQPVHAVGVALGLVGLVWIIRILRGPRDNPPAWRYRDR